VLRLLTCAFLFAASVFPQAGDWTQPFPAHRVIDNIYYVGSKGLASYLITTTAGHVLINTNLEQSVSSTAIKKLTGAQYMVMEPDVEEIQFGGKGNFQYGNQLGSLYPPVKVDRVLHDGDEVKLGDTVLTARLTPGHTKGCTTWTMKAKDGGKTLDVVIVGSPNVNPGYRLLDNPKYPGIAGDYERTFRTLKALHCDVFLGAHGDYYSLQEKYARLKEGQPNPFIDPAGYKAYITDREAAFRAELKKQTDRR
jgi:metallo-beta-lactamase class B